MSASLLGVLASCGGDGATDPDTPGPVPVATVAVEPTTARVATGATTTLRATARAANGSTLSRAITWTSSAVTIARVDANGVVTGVAAGTATITATSEGRSGTAAVTVDPPAEPVATVEIATALDTLEAFDTRTLQATTRNARGEVLTGREVRWTSSNPAVATIDVATGVLTGVDRGTVTVIATSEGRSATVTRVVVIRYRSITAGSMHACDIASGGIAWCWGLVGAEGRLGDGRVGVETFSATPIRVPGTARYTSLASYGRHTCGLTDTGRVFCWGYNGWGQLGAGSGSNQIPTPTAVQGDIVFRAITVGAEHSCGVAADGRTLCWGNNGGGQLGTGTTASRDTPTAIAGATTFATVDGGTLSTCALTAVGAAFCWGSNPAGQLGTGNTTSSNVPVAVAGGHAFRTISASDQHSCGVTTAGQGLCWGANGGRLGNGNSNDFPSPQPVAGGLLFRAISAGFSHSCGVTTDDAVWCWGQNRYGQLGTADGGFSDRPVRAGGALRASEVVAAGIGTGLGGHSCAISLDRLTAVCWGLNDAGQGGNGGTAPVSTVNATPTIVLGQRPLPVP